MYLVDFNTKNIKILGQDTQWILVAEDIDLFSASITEAFLGDKEIPCVTLNQMDRSYTVMLGKSCTIKFYVPLDMYHQARELLESYLLATDSDIDIE